VEVSEIAASDWNAMRTGAGLLTGRPVADVALRLLGDEIVVTGDHVNKTYMDAARNASTKIALGDQIWHRTGDAGRLDAAGRLWLLGRLDGKAGGLFPFCIEAAARFWPGVRRAALAEIDGRSVLAIEGDVSRRPAWVASGLAIGVERVVALDAIPLDRRHRSKVDYVALRADLRSR
jgi:acyl-CoA synthetase (AMP-forming)/AMP-acid ligase II